MSLDGVWGFGKKGRLKPEMGFAPIQGFSLGRMGDFEIGKWGVFFLFSLTLDRMKELQCRGRDDKESEICDAIGSPYKDEICLIQKLLGLSMRTCA